MSVRFYEDVEQATMYAQFRPTYSKRIYSILAEYCEIDEDMPNKLELAVDVGCGSGQSTVPLCKLFNKVIGYDVSQQQIASAPKDVDNLSFKVGPGENLSFLEDSSVDLITIAQALHWLDLDLFYPEVRRVLKTHGVFAAYGYGSCIINNQSAQDIFTKFYKGLLGSYSADQRRHVDENYKNMDHPFPNCKIIVSDDLQICMSMPTDAFVGYISSMSSWRSYLKQHLEAKDLDQIKKQLDDIYEDQSMDVHWPGFILIGRK